MLSILAVQLQWCRTVEELHSVLTAFAQVVGAHHDLPGRERSGARLDSGPGVSFSTRIMANHVYARARRSQYEPLAPIP